MPDGGKLILETGSAFLDENYASLHSEVRPGLDVLIAVSDTEAGIAAGILDRVFDPFFTSKEPGKGTGVALLAKPYRKSELAGMIRKALAG